MGEQTQGAQILLVDDDADQLALCQRWLNTAGYQVPAAATWYLQLRCGLRH